MTEKEYEKLNDQFRSTGIRYFSDYLRLLILDKRGSGNITNKKELIKQLDAIGAQISKTGSNINQIAKYANIQIKIKKVHSRTLERFNKKNGSISPGGEKSNQCLSGIGKKQRIIVLYQKTFKKGKRTKLSL